MYTKIDNIKIHYDFNDGIKVNVDGPDNTQKNLRLVNLFKDTT